MNSLLSVESAMYLVKQHVFYWRFHYLFTYYMEGVQVNSEWCKLIHLHFENIHL